MNTSRHNSQAMPDSQNAAHASPGSAQAVGDSFTPRILIAPGLVFLLGAMMTGIVYYFVQNSYKENTRVTFERQAVESTQIATMSLGKYSNLVWALQGMFHSSEEVSRKEFRTFLDSIELLSRFPGVKAVSWSVKVPTTEIAQFEAKVRNDRSLFPEGLPDFKVFAPPEGDTAMVVTYAEPYDDNKDAVGFNSANNPKRMRAIEKARDTGKLVATPPVDLMTNKGDIRKGFLMILPVYSPFPVSSLEERRDHFVGMVVSVFRVEDIVSQSFGNGFSYTGIRDSTNDALPEKDRTILELGTPGTSDNVMTVEKKLSVGGREWTITYQSNSAENAWADFLIAGAIIGLGLLVSLLAALLYGSLATSRQRAIAQAQVLTRDLRIANGELTRSNADLSQFAHVASHDLQTPIGNVIAAVNMLEDHLSESADADTRYYLELLTRSGVRMRALVSDLLEYARVGKTENPKDTVDLNSVIEQVKDSTRELRKATGARIICEDLPVCIGRAHQLERFFENLVTNAIKYAVPDRTPEVNISALNEEGDTNDESSTHCTIRVRDNAEGIDVTHWDRVFEPFRRLHRQDDIPGTGLGLSICKQIVEQHGGSIHIEHSDGNGTTFVITLPKA